MATPVDAIRVFHNAFRNDLERIDAAALNAAQGKKGLETTIDRFRFFNEILVWHAQGEEEAVFPALETVAPLVAEAYVKDHRGLDEAFDELNSSYAARDTLKTARATAAFRFHMNIHLLKEDTAPLPDLPGTGLPARTGQSGWNYGGQDSKGTVRGNGGMAVSLNRERRS